ncbi:MAG: Ig-like domain-containing protein [Thermoplasmatota archaeon]
MGLLFTFSGPGLVSGIVVSEGDLSGDTHWRIADSPVILEGNVTVPAGITLTIDPGVTVKLAPSAGIWVEGIFLAAGSGTSPIILDKSHTSFYFDGINITGGGYGYLDHISMTGSAGGVKVMGMGSRAYVYNSTLMGNSAGFRGMTGALGWTVNCTFNAPANVTAASSAVVHECKWFFLRAVSDYTGSGMDDVTAKVYGEKYPNELDEWTVFDSTINDIKTGSDGVMPPIAVNQYKHNGATSSVRVEITMTWERFKPAKSWRYNIKDPGIFVGDNFNMTWYIDETPPPKPTNFRIGNRTGNSIELLWDLNEPPSDLKTFRIDYKRTQDLQYNQTLSVGKQYRKVLVDSLQEETGWEFIIQSEDYIENTHGFTTPVTGWTLDITPPQPPKNFSVKELGGEWVKLKWKPSSSDDIVGFWIFLSATDGSWNLTKYIDGEFATEAELTGLPSETEIWATIHSVDDAETPNHGPNSTAITFVTLDITPPVTPELEFFPLDSEHHIPGSLYFNTSLVGFKVTVPGEDRTVIEIKLDGKEFKDPEGIIERWTTYGGVFQYYFFLAEGKHFAQFRSIDPSQNAGPYNSSNIWVDLTPPEMFIEGAIGNTIQFFEGDSIELLLNITDENEIDNVSWTVSNNYTFEETYGTSFSLDLDVGSYSLTVTGYDIAGNWITLEYDLLVSIPDTLAPGVVSIEPEDGEMNVELGPTISIRFSEIIEWDALSASLIPEGGPPVVLLSNLNTETRTISYYSEDTLLGGTNYTFSLRTIRDLSGNTADDIMIKFRTISEEDIDTDGDGIPDIYELKYGFLSPSDNTDAAEDEDRDGLNNLQEYQKGTEPDNPDTDADGIPDGKEVEWGMDPTWASDAQGDLDGDDYTNLEEYEKGSDPLDPKSTPEVDDPGFGTLLIILIIIIIVIVLGAVLFAIVYLNKKKVAGKQPSEEIEGSQGLYEEKTWSEQEEEGRGECPFCGASLYEGLSYCPECGMELPEKELEEGHLNGGSIDDEPDGSMIDDAERTGSDTDLISEEDDLTDKDEGIITDDPIG